MFTRIKIAPRETRSVSLAVRIRAASYAIKEAEAGHGEVGGNNLGPHVSRYIGRPALKDIFWCAGFAGWCLARGFEDVAHRPLPFNRSLHSKTFHKQLVKWGREVNWRTEPLQRGDVLTLHRGREGSRSGHTAVVIDPLELGVARTIEGNLGPYPSLVKWMMRDLWTSRVYGVVRAP